MSGQLGLWQLKIYLPRRLTKIEVLSIELWLEKFRFHKFQVIE